MTCGSAGKDEKFPVAACGVTVCGRPTTVAPWLAGMLEALFEALPELVQVDSARLVVGKPVLPVLESATAAFGLAVAAELATELAVDCPADLLPV